MGWEDSLGNMRALDAWRAAIGQQYECEKPEKALRTATGRPLQRAAWANMKYGKVPGAEKPASRLVMGVDNQRAMPHAAAMFDDYFERGGNCFDCAWIYSGGACEKLLGQWVKNRGVRGQVVILDKGAHTPNCNPGAIGRQLAESLERLQMDHVDIYMMHRDNPEVPVGEFADALNAELRAGRCRAFGGSNWTLQRVKAFNDYAREHGLAPMAAVSNQLSLARPLDVPWKGCLSAWDPEYRRWLAESGTALMPWSSQARGFFTGRARPEDLSDAELVRCWYSEDNFKRLERARELAAKRGVPPIVVALAWVLCQPFPTFPLIGPRQIGETRVSFQALELELTAEEAAWLNLED
jgi:aryl-alcohol dehydrogenase-like predicted oxidoreductase